MGWYDGSTVALVRRTVGWVRLLAWGGALYLSVLPWGNLGGLVDERLRWLEWFVLGVAGIAGCTAGLVARDACAVSAVLLATTFRRSLHYPSLLLVAAGMLFLHTTRRDDAIGVLLTGGLAFVAGVDVGFDVWRQISKPQLATTDPSGDESRP